jgi:hypothetical protein
MVSWGEWMIESAAVVSRGQRWDGSRVIGRVLGTETAQLSRLVWHQRDNLERCGENLTVWAGNSGGCETLDER